MKRMAHISAALLATVGMPSLGFAADLALDQPPPVAQDYRAPGLWRGHFSGGANYDPGADRIALAWIDRVAFFPDRLSCRQWIRGLRAQVRPYEGYTGCLRIR